MKIYRWEELVLLAKQHSPYYEKLYQGINSCAKLSDIPIVDQEEFWAANTIRENRLLTGAMTDGIVFKSGGTTGNPKFSVYTRDEWNLFTAIFGEGISKAGLSRGDRIANLFYVGELYASFIFAMKSIESAPIPTLQFPITGGAGFESILKAIQEFNINVIAGVPTTILNLFRHYAEQSPRFPGIQIQKILFGGESMYPDQRKQLQAILPGVKILSIGYASVDAGLLGYVDSSCGADEHRVFGGATILEIVDEETGEPIHEIDRPGKVLITNLLRALMPVIRYPAGDCAVWKEPQSKEDRDRKFLILGRSEEAARVGPVSVYYEDMRRFIENANLGIQIAGFQLVIRHFETKDALVLRVAAAAGSTFSSKEIEEKIVALFNLERPMFAHEVAQKIIHPLSIEWTAPESVEINPRTGKIRRVLDQRK